MRVFLSHNSSNKEFVKRVALALKKKGLTPWLDIWEMGPGDLLLPTLERAIETCDCFLLFWSTNSKSAPWVEWERQNADKLRDKRKICIRLDSIVPPPELAQRIWLDWLNWNDTSTFDATLQTLIRSIYGKPYEEPSKTHRRQSYTGIRRIKPTRKFFEELFFALSERYGIQKWWVRDDKFQLCLEAILSQGAGWKNVGLAIENLKKQDVLAPKAILDMEEPILRDLIRACGRANVKASYIKNFVNFLNREYELQIDRMILEETTLLRRKLLSIKGIGEFTCDNILLYGAGRPKLPINDRMRKVFFEHDLIDEIDTYESVQNRMENVLPFGIDQIREFDALIYRVAKNHCHPVPDCKECPLKRFLHKQGPRSSRTNLSIK